MKSLRVYVQASMTELESHGGVFWGGITLLELVSWYLIGTGGGWGMLRWQSQVQVVMTLEQVWLGDALSNLHHWLASHFSSVFLTFLGKKHLWLYAP